MRNALIALLFVGVLLFGCTGGGQPTAQPTQVAEPSKVAAAISPDYEEIAKSDEAQIASLNELTKQLEEADMQVTEEELNSLG